jgi:hypothetical protein
MHVSIKFDISTDFPPTLFFKMLGAFSVDSNDNGDSSMRQMQQATSLESHDANEACTMPLTKKQAKAWANSESKALLRAPAVISNSYKENYH